MSDRLRETNLFVPAVSNSETMFPTGHGHSGGERVHIDHFDTYVQDALELIKAKKADYPGYYQLCDNNKVP